AAKAASRPPVNQPISGGAPGGAGAGAFEPERDESVEEAGEGRSAAEGGASTARDAALAEGGASGGRPSPASHPTARTAATVIEAAGRNGRLIVRLLCCCRDVSTRIIGPHRSGARRGVGSAP